MAYVLDSPDLGSTWVLDDPTALASSGLQAVTGSVSVTGLAAVMALRASTGAASVTGRWAGYQAAPGGLLDVTPDPAGHPLSVEIVSGPAHGTLQIEADGHFTFTPDSGWFGVDAFGHRIWSGGSPGASATVVLTLVSAMVDVTVIDTLRRTVRIALYGRSRADAGLMRRARSGIVRIARLP